MADRIIRTDFVAGELSPSLYGRADLDLYWHGMRKLENFVPRRQGGIRKRAGTELVWHIAGTDGEIRDYKVFCYRFDARSFGLLALYRKNGSTVYCKFFAKRDDGTIRENGEQTIPFLFVSRSMSLDGIRSEQIGDTFFFTFHGFRAFTAKVYFDTMAVEWKQLDTSISVPEAPALKIETRGFDVETSTTDATRQYALWGVKNGIRSSPTTGSADIRLGWPAGAYVTVSFAPNWSQHDYYILGKYQGGQYGEVARFYMTPVDISTTYYGGAQNSSAGLDGEVWTSVIGSVPAVFQNAWRSTDPNAIAPDGRHSCGAWVASVGLNCSGTAVGAIKLWFGAKMTNGEGRVQQIGLGRNVHVVLYDTASTGTVLAEWNGVSTSYSDAPATLTLDSPAKGSSFALHFYSDSTRNEAVFVPLRGARLTSDTERKTFKDDNISPGTVIAEQDLLQVGTIGMDVDLITVWEQRLLAIGTERSPFTMWFSATGDIENFYVNRPQASDDAFEATIATTRASKILHVMAQKWLLAFTESGEYVIDSSGAMAFNTIKIKKNSGVGAHPDIQPTTTETDILFVASDARTVYQMRYSFAEDSVVPKCVSTRADHLTENHRITKMAYQRYPDSVMWFLLDDGTLASMTYDPDESTCAWARHRLAGNVKLKVVDIFESGSVRSDAGTDTTSDLFLVLRDEDAPGDAWIERFRPSVISETAPLGTIRCIDHAGYEAGDFPPGGDPQGAVEASAITLRLDPQGGNAMGVPVNVYDAVMRIRRSGKIAIRPWGGNGTWTGTATSPRDIPAENAGIVSLVHNDVEIPPRAFHNKDASLEIKSDDDLPCEILAFEVAVSFGNTKRT